MFNDLPKKLQKDGKEMQAGYAYIEGNESRRYGVVACGAPGCGESYYWEALGYETPRRLEISDENSWAGDRSHQDSLRL